MLSPPGSKGGPGASSLEDIVIAWLELIVHFVLLVEMIRRSTRNCLSHFCDLYYKWNGITLFYCHYVPSWEYVCGFGTSKWNTAAIALDPATSGGRDTSKGSSRVSRHIARVDNPPTHTHDLPIRLIQCWPFDNKALLQFSCLDLVLLYGDASVIMLERTRT